MAGVEGISEEKTPQQLLVGQVFAVHDFDKTTHRTDELVEGGHNVESACELAVEKVLGDQALAKYVALGGLRNRAPSAVVDELCDQDADSQQRAALTEDFIAAKLEPLTALIGKRLPDGAYWPRPVKGFVPHWQRLTSQSGATTGQVSSGHEAFIRKAYEVHDLPPPDVFVTDDNMRLLMAQGLPRYMGEKPAALPIDLASHGWLQKIGVIELTEANPLQVLNIAKRRVVMIGDGYEQDGGMAKNAGVKFVHLKLESSEADFDEMDFMLDGMLADGNNGK